MTTPSGAIGALASVSIATLWLATFHKDFFLSLARTQKVNAYGVYTDFGEALKTHFWFLLQDKLPGRSLPDRHALEIQVKEAFLTQFLDSSTSSTTAATTATAGGGTAIDVSDHQVLVTNSCRSVFYYVIRALLHDAQARTGKMKIKMALPAVHFGSFYRLLKGMERSMNCVIEFYEVDLKKGDWTLDQDSIDPEEIKTCDLILCQHIFGAPFTQDRLFELGKKYNIPILEDCVQSGSLFGKYKGDGRSDIVMYSGGLDKTPQTFGGGLGYFRKTTIGTDLFQKCNTCHESLPIDTWDARFTTCLAQMVHLMIAKNKFGINNLLGLIAYVWIGHRGDPIKWFALSLKVRKAKAITPFQHAESGFLRKPNVPQLRSILYGLTTKKPHYFQIARREIEARDLLLSCIPKEFHPNLFPWLTSQVIQRHRENEGISEFTWVVNPRGEGGDRMEFCEYLNDHFIVTLINTTWEFDDKTTKYVSKDINNNLIYLPNINEMTDAQIRYTASILTKYCQEGQ